MAGSNQLLGERIGKAIADHPCRDCGVEIPAGTVHRRFVALNDVGRFYVQHAHLSDDCALYAPALTNQETEDQP